MSFSTLVSDLEATGSATSRQLEELQELTKGIYTLISSHTFAEHGLNIGKFWTSRLQKPL
jgi:hypothetical protein